MGELAVLLHMPRIPRLLNNSAFVAEIQMLQHKHWIDAQHQWTTKTKQYIATIDHKTYATAQTYLIQHLEQSDDAQLQCDALMLMLQTSDIARALQHLEQNLVHWLNLGLGDQVIQHLNSTTNQELDPYRYRVIFFLHQPEQVHMARPPISQDGNTQLLWANVLLLQSNPASLEAWLNKIEPNLHHPTQREHFDFLKIHCDLRAHRFEQGLQRSQSIDTQTQGAELWGLSIELLCLVWLQRLDEAHNKIERVQHIWRLAPPSDKRYYASVNIVRTLHLMNEIHTALWFYDNMPPCPMWCWPDYTPDSVHYVGALLALDNLRIHQALQTANILHKQLNPSDDLAIHTTLLLGNIATIMENHEDARRHFKSLEQQSIHHRDEDMEAMAKIYLARLKAAQDGWPTTPPLHINETNLSPLVQRHLNNYQQQRQTILGQPHTNTRAPHKSHRFGTPRSFIQSSRPSTTRPSTQSTNRAMATIAHLPQNHGIDRSGFWST